MDRKTGEEAHQRRASIKELWSYRNFRLLWLGQSISLLGDQFYFIALPWLVLQITGNPLAVGTVLAAVGVPRAVFMLIGGALSDRFTPRFVMLISNMLRMLLIMLLTVLIFTDLLQLWMVYIFALFFGFVDAFFYPASIAIIPRLVAKEDLPLGNMVIQGTAQIAFFLGPVLAGILISIASGGGNEVMTAGETIPDRRGIGLAFSIDTGTFLVSIITLWLMQIRPLAEIQDAAENLWRAVQEGILTVWNDPLLRLVFFVSASITLLFSGPINVGIPVLANSRFPEGVTAFGILMSAFGGGSLFGMLLAGTMLAPKRFALTLLGVISFLGVGLIAMPFIWHTVTAATIIGLMGMANGYVSILVITWLQNRTPAALHGRMISLIMFASIGLLPVANALAGVLLKVNLSAGFIGAGILLMLLLLGCMMHPAVWKIGMAPIEQL